MKIHWAVWAVLAYLMIGLGATISWLGRYNQLSGNNLWHYWKNIFLWPVSLKSAP